MSGPDVDVVRRKLGLSPGPYDRAAIERVIGLSRKGKIDSKGEVNEQVAEALGESEANKAQLVPQWYEQELYTPFEAHASVRAVRRILELPDSDIYDPDVESAVRRFQSSKGLEPNGRVDADLAQLLGE